MSALGLVAEAEGDAPPDAAGPQEGPGQLEPSVRVRLRRNRLLVATVLLVLLVLGLLAYLGSNPAAGYLAPDAVDPSGSRALAHVLEGQGVQVVPVTTAQAAADALRGAASGSTLLVTTPDLVSTRMGQALDGVEVDHVVLVGSVPESPGPWPTPAVVSGVVAPGVLDPACGWAPALRAGSALTGGSTFTAAGAASCYKGSVLDLPAGAAGTPAQVTGSVTLLGSGQLMTNQSLASDGNAALATAVLGRDPVLVWWNPTIADPMFAADPDQQPSLSDLLPAGLPWVAWQLMIGVLVLAYARGRRFGPVVHEPLPVTVRAAEAVEGLSRLYRRGQDRGHAATVLARAAQRRVALDLRLPSGATTDQVVMAAAARTGRSDAQVRALLAPAEPPDDAALVRLADDLEHLERQVRRP